MFTLDPLPERITDVERWQTAAGAIEAYRSRWDLDGTVAVGPEPAEPEQRAHRDRTGRLPPSAQPGSLPLASPTQPEPNGKPWPHDGEHPRLRPATGRRPQFRALPGPVTGAALAG